MSDDQMSNLPSEEGHPPMVPSGSDPGLPDLPAISHQGQRVITTELLARVYGVEPKSLQDNFQDSRSRFTVGIHFYKIEGADLRSFKDRPENFGSVGKQARSLTLWTERGAARHAKMLSTDQAWAVFGKLEDAYFDAAEAEPQLPSKASPGTALRDFKAFKEFGQIIGLDRSQAILRANKAVHRTCGVDLLAALDNPLIEAPHQEQLLTATTLGAKIGGLSPEDVNLALTAHGFQKSWRDHKNRLQYEATDLGLPHSRMIDQDKERKSGAPVVQLRWLTSIIEPLQAAMSKEPDPLH